MRKLFTTLLFLLLPSLAFAATEMGWDSTMQTSMQAADTANDTEYENWLVKTDAGSCSNDNYGLQYAYAYKESGTSSYCTTAFTNNGGCVAGASRNKTRDCFVERAIAYSICADVVSAGNKTTWESQLDSLRTSVQ